jgi:hypothetical protein
MLGDFHYESARALAMRSGAIVSVWTIGAQSFGADSLRLGRSMKIFIDCDAGDFFGSRRSHLSAVAGQFRTTVKGVGAVSFRLVLTRNRFPFAATA